MNTYNIGLVSEVREQSDYGGWSIERDCNGAYALYRPDDLRAAPVHWDSSGRCWTDWQSPQDGEGISFWGPTYAADLGNLHALLADAEMPKDVDPEDPKSIDLIIACPRH